MMGWHVSVYLQSNGGGSPATPDSERGARLAVWQTHPWGLKWLYDLASAGKAIDLGGDGYPNRFTGLLEYLLPSVEDPPEANWVWGLSDNDTVLDGWVGRTKVDDEAIRQCRPDEWLLIVIWDES